RDTVGLPRARRLCHGEHHGAHEHRPRYRRPPHARDPHDQSGFNGERMTTTPLSADVLVIGWGLAGLVAAAEATAAGQRVILLDQEPRSNLGGQAWWSFGGLFFVDSPEQRRLGIKDSLELATQDWFGNAGFDRDEDHW